MDTSHRNTSAAYPVYVGLWTNWSYGPVYGSMLTLAQAEANLLVAFVAFYVTFVLGRLWAILCLCLHMAFSSNRPRDAAYHQRQASLRNSSDSGATAWVLAQIWWLWRSRNSPTKILPFLALVILLWGATATASGFSSKIAFSNEVILTGSSCRFVYDEDSSLNITRTSSAWYYISKWATAMADYAQQCYSQSTFVDQNCINSPFVQQQLPMIVNQTAGCPFDPSICATKSQNLLIDTGYLDTDHHFGINTQRDGRTQFRAIFHCGPLITKGYVADFQSPEGQGYRRYLFGNTSYSDQGDTYTYRKQNFSGSILTNTARPSYSLE
ncbi:hypothetical protein GGR51DRAFT_575003 [Nemania sp. FL0031]|nr:hypothetical protein GGR51DRAFT_575003 [Nemania sp. FL0031]